VIEEEKNERNEKIKRKEGEKKREKSLKLY